MTGGWLTGARVWRIAVVTGSALAALGLANTARNLRVVRAPAPLPGSASPAEAAPESASQRDASAATPGTPRVSVLLPLRDEAQRVRPCLAALPAQDCAEIVVLDDASTDGTAEVVAAVLGHDPRLRLLQGQGDPPPGWLGKPWACQRLADAATGEVLVFVDADVVLAPDAVAQAVGMLAPSGSLAEAATGPDILCPYPRQVPVGWLGRLVQPLLQWSWLTTLPLDVAERSRRPSTAAGNGQFLLVRASAYRAAGGHEAVAGEVLEDVALVRAVKAAGGTGGMADGTTLATCRMYESTGELIDGYTKSLWSAFGSPMGAAGACASLLLTYLAPPIAMVVGPGPGTRAVGAAGYAAAVAGRVLVAHRTDQHVPDSAAHPASIVAFCCLVAMSWHRRRAGTLSWRGRAVH